jgi:hypothetical protein
MLKKKTPGGGGGADLDGELRKISSAGDNDRGPQYKTLGFGLVEKKDVDGVMKLVNHCTDPTVTSAPLSSLLPVD